MQLVGRSKGGIDVEIRHFQNATRQWALITGRTQQQVLRTAAKMTLSNPRQGSGLLQITPPASQGVSGIAAKKQGERSIDRDLAEIFVPVRYQARRDPVPPRPGPIQRRHFAQKRPGKPIRRDRLEPYYVDERAFRAMERELKRRVGWLASGWLASARALGAAVPAWVARHGTSRGMIRMSFSAPRYGIEMTCFAPSNSPWQELERRIPYALRYATNNLERQIRHQFGKDAAAVGLRPR